MKNLSKLGLAIIILAAGIVAAVILVLSKPEAKKEPPVPVIPTVEVLELRPQDIEIVIPSQGIIEPITQTTVAAEVAGRIVEVSPAFEAGERFQKDEILLRIDDTDYVAAHAQAVAALRDAELARDMEYAKRDQALRDWEKLKTDREPGDLVQRLPQVKSAEARVAAALAAVEKAAQDIARTKLRAPYEGRIRSTATDLGSYAAPGSPLAELYRTDILEIRLPISLDDYAFVESPGDGGKEPLVHLQTEIAGNPFTWTARVVRTEGQVDRASRSVHLVARMETKDIEARYENVAADLLAPGLFVHAKIAGTTLREAFRVPRQAVYSLPSSHASRAVIVMVDDENRLYLQPVRVSRTEGAHLIIEKGGGIDTGQRVCVTALDTVVEKMSVHVAGNERTAANPAQAAGDALTESPRP